jgi:uncharacterized protein (TIGR02646 family)
MRYIDKSKRRCTDFDNYVVTKRPRKWKKFDADIKLKLHQHLLNEQQHLCVYCQQSVPQKHVKDNAPLVIHPSHVEHVRPKDEEQYPHLTFDYLNLAVSCNGFDVNNTLVNTYDFCGHPKANTYDEMLFLHPFETLDIEDYFNYTINGEIKATIKDVNRANYTIKTLQLDNAILNAMREEQYLIISEETLNNDLDIATYLDENQIELPKFYSMLKQLFFI